MLSDSVYIFFSNTITKYHIWDMKTYQLQLFKYILLKVKMARTFWIYY